MDSQQRILVLAKITSKLRLGGPQSARELQAITDLSQPQLSRYLKLLGTQVLKIGQGKKSRYVHTREIPQIGSHIPIFRVTQLGKLEQRGTLHPIAPKGFYWKSKNSSLSRTFGDLPYFLNDLHPSGFLGRLIPRTYPDWGFPEDTRLWTAESTLRYLTYFGVDLIGDQIIGEIAAQKFLETTLQGVTMNEQVNEAERYDALAREVETHGLPGSSAGGEHPKFVTRRTSDGTPVIVKFIPNSDNEITRRRIDLLRAEHVAAEILAAYTPTATTRMLEGADYTFLEIIRFDRAGLFGRRGIISLLSLDAEFVGSGKSWDLVAEKLHDLEIFDEATLEEIRFREFFGRCIGNTDMHGGNLSFFVEEEMMLGIAPVYDMLPMKYAPLRERLSSETIATVAPRPSGISTWERARAAAICYWQHIQAVKEFTPAFIDIAQRNERYLSSRSIAA